MEIRINNLTLHNFKGVRGDRTVTFNGRNATIEGDNGTGKSTIFDAFTWLLFGKDHQGRDWTNFNIKPIDPATKETIHGLDGHWVEAELTIDGVTKTLRRVVSEDWVKPKGETERVLKGHTQQFFIDGVDCGTKKNYDLAIHQWIDEDVFKIVTNPLFFIDDRFTPWQQRRKILLSSVGYNAEAVAKDFADLLKEINGTPLEQFRRQLAAAKRAQREDVEKATANIDAWNAALPQEEDTASIYADISRLEGELAPKLDDLNAKIAKADEGIKDIAEAAKDRRDEISQKNAQILALKKKMDDFIAEGLKSLTAAKSGRIRAISEASTKYETAKSELKSLEVRERNLRTNLESLAIARGDEAARLTELGRKYSAERDAAFTPDVETVCPHCGRPYPEDVIEAKGEQLRAEWQNARLKAMREIQSRVPEIRAELDTLDQSITKTDQEIREVQEAIKSKLAEIDILDDQLRTAMAAPEIDTREAELRIRKSDGFIDLSDQAAALEREIDEISSSIASPAELMNDRQRYLGEIYKLKEEHEKAVRPYKDKLAVNNERKRILGMIADEEGRRALLTDELARLERLEVRTLQYIKASVDACEDAINAAFRETRWKMFDSTLDGGIVEMCEATTLDGVPYRSMNDAMRTICGLDVIRVLSEANSVQAPIFIDNAEGVTRRDFGTGAQIIRLVVKEGAELTVNEE